jgi:hypothetical protein
MNWPNIFVDQGQFNDPDFIRDTNQRGHVQFADKNVDVKFSSHGAFPLKLYQVRSK